MKLGAMHESVAYVNVKVEELLTFLRLRRRFMRRLQLCLRA